jgi:hypothetical protein
MTTPSDETGHTPFDFKSGGPPVERRRQSGTVPTPPSGAGPAGGPLPGTHGFAAPLHGSAPPVPNDLAQWRAIYWIEREAIYLRRVRWQQQAAPAARASGFERGEAVTAVPTAKVVSHPAHHPAYHPAGDVATSVVPPGVVPPRDATPSDPAALESLAKYMRPEAPVAPPKKNWLRRSVDGVRHFFGLDK